MKTKFLALIALSLLSAHAAHAAPRNDGKDPVECKAPRTSELGFALNEPCDFYVARIDETTSRGLYELVRRTNELKFESDTGLVRSCITGVPAHLTAACHIATQGDTTCRRAEVRSAGGKIVDRYSCQMVQWVR